LFCDDTVKVAATLKARRTVGILAQELDFTLMLPKKNGNPTIECILTSQKRFELFT